MSGRHVFGGDPNIEPQEVAVWMLVWGPVPWVFIKTLNDEVRFGVFLFVFTLPGNEETSYPPSEKGNSITLYPDKSLNNSKTGIV